MATYRHIQCRPIFPHEFASSSILVGSVVSWVYRYADPDPTTTQRHTDQATYDM